MTEGFEPRLTKEQELPVTIQTATNPPDVVDPGFVGSKEYTTWGVASLVAQTVKNPTALQKTGFDPWVRKISWRREWLHIPEFLPGESHGQRSLVGYSPWGHKELDTTEGLSLSIRKGTLIATNFDMELNIKNEKRI